MLDVQKVSKSYRGPNGIVPVLQEFSLTVSAGEFVAVRGPSGCGKSTLLLAAGGLLHPNSGHILVDNQDLYALSSEARAHLRATAIGFVFQQFHLVPYLSVLDNVRAPALAAAVPDVEGRAHELLERFGMKHRLRHVPAELSIGERQRTALARALLNRPKLLLADEPTGNLDQENGALVLRCLADFAAAGGAVLLVTHEREAAAQAGRIVDLGRA